jgi:hypothetical protein
MIKRLALLLVLFAALAAASAARSQQPTGKGAPSSPAKDGVRVRDSVEFKPSPELQKSLDDLAASVEALAHRIATDPQIRSDAMRVASGLVTTTQRVVTEESVVLQGALRTAADRIAAAQSQHSSSKKP